MVHEQNSEIILKKQLFHLLHDKSITAAELARRSGVPKQTISDWLGGCPPRNLQALRSIAKVFDTTIEFLVFGDDLSNTCGFRSKHCIPRDTSERLASARTSI